LNIISYLLSDGAGIGILIRDHIFVKQFFDMLDLLTVSDASALGNAEAHSGASGIPIPEASMLDLQNA
jgi:hypothetical protein